MLKQQRERKNGLLNGDAHGLGRYFKLSLGKNILEVFFTLEEFRFTKTGRSRRKIFKSCFSFLATFFRRAEEIRRCRFSAGEKNRGWGKVGSKFFYKFDSKISKKGPN